MRTMKATTLFMASSLLLACSPLFAANLPCTSIVFKNTTTALNSSHEQVSFSIFAAGSNPGGNVVPEPGTNPQPIFYKDRPDPWPQTPAAPWIFGVQLNINRVGPVANSKGKQQCDNVCGHISVNMTTGAVATDTTQGELGTCGSNANSPWWGGDAKAFADSITLSPHGDGACTVTVNLDKIVGTSSTLIHSNTACACEKGSSTPCAPYTTS